MERVAASDRVAACESGFTENKCRSFGSAEKRFAQDDRLFLGSRTRHRHPANRKTNAGPSAPLKSASLRMTASSWGSRTRTGTRKTEKQMQVLRLR